MEDSMRRIILVLLVSGLMIFGCTKKAENEIKEGKVEIKMYLLQQVPFSANLAELEKLGNVNFNKVLDNYVQYDPNTLDKIAFKLGSDIADALVCLKAKNKTKLTEITKNLPNYGEALGISKQFIMLSVSLKPLIDKENWQQIEQKLEEYQKKIVDELYNMKSFDHVVLVQFGGWIKGLEDVSFVLSNEKYDKEATKVLHNKTMIVALDHDINNLSDENILAQTYLKTSISNIKNIKEMIFSSEDGYFDKGQVEKINVLSKEITDGFSK